MTSSRTRGPARAIAATLAAAATTSLDLEPRSLARGFAAGAAGAAVWAAAEPHLQRLTGSTYSDTGLVAETVGRRRARDLAVHEAVGGAFGAAFAAVGGHGALRGTLAGLAQNTLTWPMMATIDRLHPAADRPRWPHLLTNRRAFVQSTLGHAVYGAVLGALVPARSGGG